MSCFCFYMSLTERTWWIFRFCLNVWFYIYLKQLLSGMRCVFRKDRLFSDVMRVFVSLTKSNYAHMKAKSKARKHHLMSLNQLILKDLCLMKPCCFDNIKWLQTLFPHPPTTTLTNVSFHFKHFDLNLIKWTNSLSFHKAFVYNIHVIILILCSWILFVTVSMNIYLVIHFLFLSGSLLQSYI